MLLHPRLAYGGANPFQTENDCLGLDGCPHLAWKSGGGQLAIYILDLVGAFCSDAPLPSDINFSLSAVIEKKDEALVHAEAAGMVPRHPQTRPLSFKQADNKLAAVVRNFCIYLAIAEGAADIQRGLSMAAYLPNLRSTPDCSARFHAAES